MLQEGVQVILDSSSWGVTGITEIHRVFPKLLRAVTTIFKEVEARQIRNLILVDYPGFNLMLAKRAKRNNLKVFYYIPPMLANRYGRKGEKVASFTDLVIPIFKKEWFLYKNSGANAHFFGHPLLDHVPFELARNDAISRLNITDGFPVLGLLPGSRIHEVERIFPVMLEAVEKLLPDFPALQACVSVANESVERTLAFHIIQKNRTKKHLKLIRESVYPIMKAAHLLLVCSGTATLEASLMETPMIILYKASKLTGLLSHFVLRDIVLGLPNIVLQKKVVPELLQEEASAERVYQEAAKFLLNPQFRDEQVSALKQVRNNLGSPGGVKKAATLLLQEFV